MTDLSRVRDEVEPEGKWKFDEEVTEAFDDMLERSIPQYNIMRETVLEVAAWAANRSTASGRPISFLDLGTSRGEALARLVDHYGARATYVGVEVSDPMLAAVSRRFEGWSDYVKIVGADLREHWPYGSFDVILSVLTLMFIPINYRQRIVRRAFESLHPGGALIVVEKVLGAGELDELMVDSYHARKADSGYSKEAIERKRLSLEGVLVPVTDEWNRELLEDAGFRPVDCFWRWMNFAGYVAVKPE